MAEFKGSKTAENLMKAFAGESQARNNPKVTFLWNTIVSEVLGDEQHVTGVRLHDIVADRDYDLPTDGVFVYIGTVPNTDFLHGKVEVDEQGFIKADCCFRTSMPGVFTAGDVRSGAWRQIVVVAAEGALAVREIELYLAEEALAGAEDVWQTHPHSRG